jgi:phosphomannomutase
LGQSPADGSLERLEQLYQAGVDRPARSYGRMSRFQADVPYLAAMSESYHALRPLRVVVDSASQPWMEYLQRLASAVACQIIPSRVARHERSEQIRADSAHFAVCIDGDGETCQIFDEQGRAVSAEQILLLLARGMSLGHMVLEQGTSAATIERLERLGMRVTVSSVRRADMMAAMKAENAILGGGPSGRFWHAVAGVPLPDALMTVTRLLVLLSRGDEPFSAVLDREVPLR